MITLEHHHALFTVHGRRIYGPSSEHWMLAREFGRKKFLSIYVALTTAAAARRLTCERRLAHRPDVEVRIQEG